MMTYVFAMAAAVGMAQEARGSSDSAPPRAGTLAKELDLADAWAKLPVAEKDPSRPLPSWARMMATSLPRTAAALLRLDYAHRAAGPIEPKLRAAMRYVAARSNGCEYSMAYALADAQRAKLPEAAIKALVGGDDSAFSEAERAALEFARKMTLASSSVTDEEFAALVRHFGENRTAAMVLLMASANFQDRLYMCLGTEVEADGPLAPMDVTLAENKTAQRPVPPPARTAQLLPEPKGSDVVRDDGEWKGKTYVMLQEQLEKQRQRPTRLKVPSWEQVEKNLPEGFMRRNRVVWNMIVMGYAPALAMPFDEVMRSAGAEVGPKYDRIFGGSLFWVVTKAIDCPYCMGHCEMNWEVAGLSSDEIAQRSKLLSGDDWSSFPPAEQRAFAFARKLTQKPASVTDAEIVTLKEDFGPDLALVIAMSASRFNYMTRISNGFQLSLERDNVFFEYYGMTPPGQKVSSASEPFVPVLSTEEAWKRMPKADEGAGQPLPVWARAVAGQLPRTAAAMLELDLAQRTKSPIDPQLRAKMRWVIANANRCEYSKATALADLAAAGGDKNAIAALQSNAGAWSDNDREPLEFARLLTVNAPSIPDSLFESLRERYGDSRVAAMVLLGAYGNFQDRIILGLGLPLESEGAMAPVKVAFAPGGIQMIPVPLTTREAPALLKDGKSLVARDPEWSELSYDELQSRMEEQRARKCRLPIPAWDDVKKKLPAALAQRPIRIVWTLVCLGYVPELAVPWNNATRTLWAEAKSDRVLEESLFWIQTRAIRCNYCMGHCEMLLEVAGLNKEQIADRTRVLAGDDWSAFPPEEQRAYALARKLSKTPWELTKDDYRTLVADYGDQRGMSLFWWLCRGLYMTRVSDGFQLPLERENVFSNFFPKGEGASTGESKR